MKKTSLQKLMIADLARSGLDAKDARKLKLRALKASDARALTGIYNDAYLIPYFDLEGNRAEEYWRLRFIGIIQGGFGTPSNIRYRGPKGLAPRIYLPPLLKWLDIAKDPSVEIIITEGEKKAAKACKEKIPTIALSGVWSWKSNKKNMSHIPCFDKWEWTGRRVLLCFDSDLKTNPSVLGALNALAGKLLQLGANPFIRSLSSTDDNKVGLDDFLKSNGAEAFNALPTEQFSSAKELWALNEEVAFITQLHTLYDIRTRSLFQGKQQFQMTFANRTYEIIKAGGDGTKTAHAPDEWLRWKSRREYSDLIYMPGEDLTVSDKLNTWQGWGAIPEKGNVSPFKDLIDYLFSNDPETGKWFWQWIAYPLQHPGSKLATAVVLHSNGHGVGKTFVGDIMGTIYGENYSQIGQDELQSSFNGWAVDKQFILGEEITGLNSRKDADRIKNMITQKTFMVNKKYEPTYQTNDRANYLFTSNHPDAFFLEPNDRRFMVHEITQPKKPRRFYRRIGDWQKDGGASYLHHYLLNEIDTSSFDQYGPAPFTVAKESMIALSNSHTGQLAQEIIENADNFLSRHWGHKRCDFAAVNELLAMVDPDGRSSAVALGKALKRLGVPHKLVKTCDGSKRLQAIRNQDSWINAASAEWREAYDAGCKGKGESGRRNTKVTGIRKMRKII